MDKQKNYESYLKSTHRLGRIVSIITLVLLVGAPFAIGTLLGAGYWGEYKVQRTGLYVRCYTIQGISLLVMALVVLILYRSCLARRRRA